MGQTRRRTGDWTVVADGLKEFRLDLKKLGATEIPNQIKAANKHLADKLAAQSQARARAVWRPSSSIAKAIAGSGTIKSAGVAMSKAKDVRVFAAEYGTYLHRIPLGRTGKTRTVRADRMSRRVFPAWTGNQWSNDGDGPAKGVGTAIQPVLRERKEWVRERYLDYLEAAFKKEAFPD